MGLAPVELAGRYRKQVMYGLYAITNFIWTISLYLSNATGYLIQEPTRWTSFPLRRIPLEKYADLGRRYHRRLVLGGILYRVPADSHSSGRDLCCLYRTHQTGTTKAIHAVVNFVVVFVLSAAFIAYALIISGKSMNFPQTSAMPA